MIVDACVIAVLFTTAWLLLALGFDALEAQVEAWANDDDGEGCSGNTHASSPRRS